MDKGMCLGKVMLSLFVIFVIKRNTAKKVH